jgi:enoyl-CoA hydratase/carnithine racemase
MTQLVLSELKGSIRTLTLNRPERLNAVNVALISALLQALIEANADKATSVIILKGAGRAFCTGNDLKDSAETLGESMGSHDLELHTRELQEITQQIVSSDKFVIGAIHGWAVGAGFEWAINCDFTVWADSAQAFFPEVSWGLSATGGVMTLLPRMVGISKAREMLLLGNKYSADQLLDLGIAWRVVPESELEQTAQEAAEKIAGLPRTAVSHFKKTFNRTIFMNLEDALEAERDVLIKSMMDAETAAIVKTFDS